MRIQFLKARNLSCLLLPPPLYPSLPFLLPDSLPPGYPTTCCSCLHFTALASFQLVLSTAAVRSFHFISLCPLAYSNKTLPPSLPHPTAIGHARPFRSTFLFATPSFTLLQSPPHYHLSLLYHKVAITFPHPPPIALTKSLYRSQHSMVNFSDSLQQAITLPTSLYVL